MPAEANPTGLIAYMILKTRTVIGKSSACISDCYMLAAADLQQMSLTIRADSSRLPEGFPNFWT